jgi:hypothetical protein
MAAAARTARHPRAAAGAWSTTADRTLIRQQTRDRSRIPADQMIGANARMPMSVRLATRGTEAPNADCVGNRCRAGVTRGLTLIYLLWAGSELV